MRRHSDELTQRFISSSLLSSRLSRLVKHGHF